MKDSTSSADSLGERTPKDYAIEHAEYMARKAERLLDAVQEHAAAYLARENDGDDPDSDEDISSLDDRCNRADEGVNEAMMHMRSSIYEFRKRRDRALAVEEPKPQAAIEAFEAKYSRSAEDPASAEMLAIWLDAWEARSIKPQAEPRFFLPDSNGRLHECKTEMLKNRLYGESVVILFGAPVAADKGEPDEAMRKDAERYRWLRDSDCTHPATARVPEHMLGIFRLKGDDFLSGGCAVSDYDETIDFCMAHDKEWPLAAAPMDAVGDMAGEERT